MVWKFQLMFCISRGYGIAAVLGLFVFVSLQASSISAQGVRFVPRQILNTDAVADTENDGDATVALGPNGVAVATWVRFNGILPSPAGIDPSGGTIDDEDIFFARTDDLGLTWSAPALINLADDDDGDDREPYIDTNDNGTWVIVWRSKDDRLNTIGNDRDILFSRSVDDGLTWSTPAALTALMATDTPDDFAPTVAANGNGVWIAGYTSRDGAFRDSAYISVSTDNGQTWGARKILEAGSDFVSTGASVTSMGGDRWLAASSVAVTSGADRDIKYTTTSDNGANWTPMAIVDPAMATDSDFEGEVDCEYDGMGRVLMIWETGASLGSNAGATIDVTLSDDFGATWSTPETVFTSSILEGFGGLDARVAADGTGKWVILWDTADDLGGTTGGEGDILMVRSNENGTWWSNPMVLTPDMLTDAFQGEGGGFNGASIHQSGGNWIVVWRAGAPGGGPTGTDGEVYFTLDFKPLNGTSLIPEIGEIVIDE